MTLAPEEVELLKALKGARKLDRDATVPPAAKAEAWAKVAAQPLTKPDAQNPLKASAEQRAAMWRGSRPRARGEAPRSRRQDRFLADRKKLDELSAPADEARRASLEASFLSAYGPFEAGDHHLGRVKLTPAPALPPPPAGHPSPVMDPTGIPVVRAQRFVLKGDFGAHVQSFSVDTGDDLMEDRPSKPTYDLSGFYAGGQAAANVAEQSGFAIGVLGYGRYHVTTSAPDSTFTSGDDDAVTLTPPDDRSTGAFAVGLGARLGGNITERIGMTLGLTAGYLQFMPPAEIPGCGEAQSEWSPTLHGFQGELFVGAEFYPLALLSFGVSGRVGFGHVESQWCVPGGAIDPTSTTTPDTVLDVSADSFSVGAQGEDRPALLSAGEPFERDAAPGG
ncbi:MAG: hypothetical protein IPM79_08265 [Polyangiaceae bacterium]|nr:hypothetical protein [Polyangiaceae bacterium]